MSILYPHLPFSLATSLAEERCSKTVADLQELSKDLHLASVFYSPTGGSKVTVGQLGDLQNTLRTCAEQFGYPTSSSEKLVTAFDTACTELLFEKMDIMPSEASDLRVWSYLTCVLVPDIVRWRFPGEQENTTALARFLGSDRGVRRNTFGRLWWRAFLLHLPHKPQKYELIQGLNEDELVQITERPSLAADPLLSREVAAALLSYRYDEIEVTRRELFRDVVKRLRRLFPIIRFQTLEVEEVKLLVDYVFNLSIHAFTN